VLTIITMFELFILSFIKFFQFGFLRSLIHITIMALNVVFKIFFMLIWNLLHISLLMI